MGLKLRSLVKEDLDVVFAYRTDKCLTIKDKDIGWCNRLFELLLIIYFFIIAAYACNAYDVTEMSTGISILHTSAGGFSVINSTQQGVYDALDVTYPNVEGNTVFAATSAKISYGQSRGTCPDPTRKCTTAVQCITQLNETCTGGFCNGPNWCSPGNAAPTTASYDIFDHYLIWINPEMSFNQIDSSKIYSSINKNKTVEYPDSGANTYSINDLLNIGGYNYRDIKDDGAIFKVTSTWDCHVGHDCSPSLEVTRIDDFGDDYILGAISSRFYYYQQNNVEYRDIFNMTGVQMIFDSKGIGTTFSFNLLVFQFAACVVFIRFCSVFVDYWASSRYMDRYDNLKSHRIANIIEEPESERTTKKSEIEMANEGEDGEEKDEFANLNDGEEGDETSPNVESPEADHLSD